MPKRLVNITGFDGVDATTDPYVLGKDNQKKSVLSYNFRAKNGVRVGRFGYEPKIQGSVFTRSGIYFPYGAKAILPNTKLGSNLATNFYCAETTAFSIEFYYKGDFESFGRYVCHIPCYFSSSAMSHMTVEFVASDEHAGETNLDLSFIVDDSGYQECTYSFYDAFPMDGDWHHVAITRSSDGSTLVAYLDVDSTALDYDTSSDGSTAAFPTADNFQEDQSEPLFYNHLQIGSSKLSIAEFRIWNDERSYAEIAANYDVSLSGTEANLVCYVPFNEADGLYFTEAVHSDRGYFTPQEPFVNDDNELVFTGYQCLALPSLRSKRVTTDYTASEETAYHYLRNEDGGYDGGILWDVRLRAGTQDWSDSGADLGGNGFFRGTAQIRLRLRELKEGVICGRLCVIYNKTYNKYYLGYFHAAVGGGSDYLYRFDGGDGSVGGIDETWIGAEKTITIEYDGVGLADPNLSFTCYIDTTAVTSTAVADPTWSSGDVMDSTGYRPYTDFTLNTTDFDNAVDGAIGGSPQINETCIAFDLLFFRQWWEEYPTQGSTDLATFVANTYDQDSLDDSFKYFVNGVSGNILDNTKGAVYLDTTDYLPFSTKEFLQYIKMPIHYGSDTHDMDGTTSEMNYTGNTTFKQDVLIKRIVRWQGWGGYWLDSSDSKTLQIDTVFGTKRRFNDGVISNLVNYFNSETFKNNQTERYVFYSQKTFTSLDSISGIYEKNLRIHGAINDDTPLQGIETFFGVVLPSKYLILSGTGSRTDTIYKQRSMKARWCTGPIYCASDETMPVRGIARFTSEDGKVNKLLAVVGCSVLTITPDSGTATVNKWGWIDRNSDAPVNFVTINNRCVIMDTQCAIKINAKGNFSRLGVERPMAIDLSTIETVDNDTFTDGQRFAYVVQYYDSENDAYSGTVPIANEYGQQLYIDGTSSGAGVDHFEMELRGCKDYNVDRFRAYRTADLEGTGSVSILYLVKDGGNSKNDAYSKFRDVWVDAQMASNSVLSAGHYGVDLSPLPSGVVGVAYERLFLFGNDDAESTLYWSNVTSLGLGKPDEFNPLNTIIVEEGGTTSGTALIEYNRVLYAFKEDSVFKVSQDAPGSYTVELLYKGIGALNQQSVIIAGDSIIFLDRTGIYGYRGGEPQMLSTELVDFFKSQVNQTNIGNAFILHNKAEEQILAFVPGLYSTYPDRCVVYDLRTGRFTIDLTPCVTCGYVDDNTIYLGTPYGKILEYSTDTYLDVVDTVIAESGSVSSLTVTSTGNFPNDGTTLGARLFIYDTSNHIWTGTVDSEVSADAVAVDAWEPLFNTTSIAPSGSVTVMVGHLYFHDKSPLYSFFEDTRDKVLHEYSLVTNRVSANSVLLFYLFDINDGGTTDDGYEVLSGYLHDVETFKGAHKHYQLTNVGFYSDAFRIKEVSHSITYTQGEKD